MGTPQPVNLQTAQLTCRTIYGLVNSQRYSFRMWRQSGIKYLL